MIQKKLLLARLRRGDYTHAGEEEAIDIVMKNIPRKNHQKILDAGCGLGGTAHYLQQAGWGEVTGIDKEESLIQQASKTYTGINFLVCDLLNVTQYFQKIFEGVTLFNVYYCLSHQKESLSALGDISKTGAWLMIFDYSTKEIFQKKNPFYENNEKVFCPINLSTVEGDLYASHWKIEAINDLTENYIAWYDKIIYQLHSREKNLIEEFGEIAYCEVLKNFTNLQRLFKIGHLQGSVIYAKRR